MKKVSVVIPAYNQAEFIRQTIESVISQTYTHLEIIISDDCSEDDTPEIIKQLANKDKRIKALFSSKNKGIPANFNKAFDACTGDYVAFLGGDDLMYTDKIEKQVNFLENNPDYVLCMHYTQFWDEKNKKKLNVHGKERPIPTWAPDWIFSPNTFYLKKFSSVIPSSCLARADYYLHARYDERLKYKHELLFTLDNYMHMPQGKWHVIPEILGEYRIHQENFSMKKENTANVFEDTFLLIAIANVRYPQLSKRLKNYSNYFLFERLLFNWIPQTYKKQYYHNAGLLKYLYLLFCKFLLKTNLLFHFHKPIGFIQKKIK